MKRLFTLFLLLVAAISGRADDAMRSTPLTLEAIEAGTFHFNNKADGAVTYTVNGGARQTIAAETKAKIAVNAGDKVAFYGDNATYYKYDPNLAVPPVKLAPKRRSEEEDDEYVYSIIGGTAPYYVYGNIMSLISSKDFASATTLTGENTFCEMFFDEKNLRNHDTKPIVLPATTLSEGCYDYMFMGCTALTVAPELPATTLADECYYYMFAYTGIIAAPVLPATNLADRCYDGMFASCTSLTQAPELPATVLKEYCYCNMFERCSSLVKAPDLPATILAPNCYFYMFQDCTSLAEAPELPARDLAESCYYGMFNGCTALTTAPELPATTLADDCYHYMFNRCKNLTTAPELLAAKLKPGCYASMFQDCGKLNYIKCLATDVSAELCTTQWLWNVASSGTFVKAKGMDDWPQGINGIPNGWTVDTEEAYTSPEQTPLTIEAIEAGIVKVVNKASGPISYTVNGDNLQTIAAAGETEIYINPGVRLSFYGDNAAYTTGIEEHSSIICETPCYIYGNVMSLIASEDFDELTTLTEPWALAALFMDNKQIRSHETKPLVLPATTLTDYCYAAMFSGCSSLSEAPTLPATELGDYCYAVMFNQCLSLTTAPELPATTLAPYCYTAMFAFCNTLSQAPALPAEELAEDCYSQMFIGCTALTTAPDLPARTLTKGCYTEMFKNCLRLESVKCLATDISADDCTTDWLESVASNGNFTKADSMHDWPTGASGIPSGWNVNEDYTGISDLTPTLSQSEGAVYDLTGRKVSSQLPKGIFVRNGRKFVTK